MGADRYGHQGRYSGPTPPGTPEDCRFGAVGLPDTSGMALLGGPVAGLSSSSSERGHPVDEQVEKRCRIDISADPRVGFAASRPIGDRYAPGI
jgi:hypothetical protein